MIDNYEDVIDSRNVIERIEQLQAIREPGPVPEGVLEDEDYEVNQDDLFRELASLEALALEGEQASEDWQYGATLIRDSYFRDYAMDLAEEISDQAERYGRQPSWPYICIDWDKAARELQMDYTSVEFNGVTYWVR